MAGGVFISYRRSDSAAFAGRIADFFAYNYQHVRVFFDVNGIAPGEDFVEALRTRIQSSEVVLAIIGESWLNAADGNGRRRLDDPNDFVRLEIGTALAMGARVIPVLLDNAQMPSADNLPPDLQQLSYCNAEFMRGAAFQRDAQHLADFVSEFLANSTKTVLEAPEAPQIEQGTPVYESLVQDFEAFERADPMAFIVVEDDQNYVQYIKMGEGRVMLDLPIIGLATAEQRAAASQFFFERYQLEAQSLTDDFDSYQVDLPLDAGYLAKATLEVFERIHNTVPTQPLISRIEV